MNRIFYFYFGLNLLQVMACDAQVKHNDSAKKEAALIMGKEIKNETRVTGDTIRKSEEEWRKILTPGQFKILREKGTEHPYTGKFYQHEEKGTYTCAGCGTTLFSSDSKFDAGCGWPSFFESLEGQVDTAMDKSLGMTRIEITCHRCGGHLGHVFDDGPKPTGLSYCVNSESLDFKKDD